MERISRKHVEVEVEVYRRLSVAEKRKEMMFNQLTLSYQYVHMLAATVASSYLFVIFT